MVRGSGLRSVEHLSVVIYIVTNRRGENRHFDQLYMWLIYYEFGGISSDSALDRMAAYFS